MSQTIYQVDAFTNRPFAGNPAGVCVLEKAADEAWMQKTAAEMNLSETGFLYPVGENRYNLRWFTPQVEVPLCGHCTLSSAHILWEANYVAADQTIYFQTKSGWLTAERQADGWIELDFPAAPVEPVENPPIALLEAIGLPAKFVGRNETRYMVEVETEESVRDLRLDFSRLKTVSPAEVIVTARAKAGADYDFVSRFFAPEIGIDEDPVTGAAHCALTPYWNKRLGKTEFRAWQVSARGGELRLKLVESQTEPGKTRVKIGGQAITVLKGQLFA